MDFPERNEPLWLTEDDRDWFDEIESIPFVPDVAFLDKDFERIGTFEVPLDGGLVDFWDFVGQALDTHTYVQVACLDLADHPVVSLAVWAMG